MAIRRKRKITHKYDDWRRKKLLLKEREKLQKEHMLRKK